mmetsp:Transcript_175143/g.561695  ORF Transcript_175143/g.561695 Transcript_175143/m.561695 type:complete len:116 (-) Transcript_175143:74-421(-)
MSSARRWPPSLVGCAVGSGGGRQGSPNGSPVVGNRHGHMAVLPINIHHRRPLGVEWGASAAASLILNPILRLSRLYAHRLKFSVISRTVPAFLRHVSPYNSPMRFDWLLSEAFLR